jgi:hypothetical protein
MDEKKLIILAQGHECLYNLQHKDYDSSLVKDSSWKDISRELHAQDKELSRRAQHCRRMAGSWQGNGMVCVNRPLMGAWMCWVRGERMIIGQSEVKYTY